MEPIYEEIHSTVELLKAVHEQDTEDRLVPSGEWEGVIHSYTKRDPAPVGHRLEGVEVWHCRAQVEGSTRMPPLYFDATPAVTRRADGRLGIETVCGARLVEATDTVGEAFTATLDKAKVTRLKFKVSRSTNTNGAKPRNWVNSIVKA